MYNHSRSLFFCILLAAQLLFVAAGFSQDITPPNIERLTPQASSTVVRLFELEVLFTEEMQGVDAGDLLINGVPATSLNGLTPGNYRFSFTQPITGLVTVAFAPSHGITDAANPPNAFVPPGPWSYELNPALALYDVRVNEFLANNQTGIRDEDGTFQDWIELYNPGVIPVSLSGCYLTDDKSDLTKWRFPTNVPPVLSPNTYLIVWASNKDRTDAAKPMHTNFRLDPNPGEYLALVDSTGTNVISEFDPTYPRQTADISYGRDSADPDIVGYYSKPTPGAINTSSGDGFAPPVQFSRDGGTFITPFTVSLSVASSNAVIRYVLVTNAATAIATVTNVPGTNSPIYAGPIPINLTTQVRVRAFEPGKLPSEPVSVTYIQIAPELASFSSDVPIVIIHNFGQGAFGGVSTDRSAVIASFHSDLYRSSVTNKPDLMTRGAANDRGSSTANQPKVNMAVEFWDEFNQDADRPFVGMPAESDWVLYGIDGFDPGMMHNAIFHWFGRKVGYSSRTRYVEVFLKVTPGPVTLADYNGVYLAEEKPKRNKDRVDIESLQPENTNAPSVTGGYLLRVDRIDGDERTFSTPDITVTNLFVNGAPVTLTYGNGPGDQVIVDYPNSIQWATDPRRAAQRFYIADYFTNFLRALTSPSFTNSVTGYPAYVDVDSWVNNHIANTICFNVDGYRLSGYLFKDRNKKLEQGPPWDCDRCLGTGGAGNTPQGDNRCYNPRQFRIVVTGFPGADPDNGTDFFGTATGTGVDWWDRMFRDPDFWQRWIDHYQQFRTNEFSNQEVLAMVDGFHNEIKESQVREQNKWGPGWANGAWPRWGVQNAQGYSFDFGSVNAANPPGGRGGYFTNEVNFQKKWLLDRLDFLDTNFLRMPVLSLGDSQVSSGTTINVAAAPKPGTLIYYTLDGTDPRLPGGGISPSALSSAGNLTLTVTNNVRLFARCYNPNHYNLTNRYVSATSYEVGKPHLNSHWSGPVAASYYTAVPPLRITELMYHPANPPAGTNDADNFEYIEVRNIGATPLNVNRFRISGGVDFEFSNQLLQPGQYGVIVRDLAAFQARYGSSALILGAYTNNLANDGDHLVLVGSVREPIHDFNYNDDWYPITDGPGFSLQIVNDAAALKVSSPTGLVDNWGFKASWRPSGVVNGSPGAADSGAATVAAVHVNEVLTHTDPLLADAIELHNTNSVAINIGGWFLTDSFNTPKKYQIPAGTMVQANGYVVFVQSNSFGVPANSFNGTNDFALSSKGEEVFVFSADAVGNLTGWVHGFDFGAQANGVTFGRHIISTGEDQFPTQTSPTVGAANSGPKVGPIVISEINYYPPDLVYPLTRVPNTIDEYIELHNISGSAVQLFDPAYPANTWHLRDAVNFSFPPNTTMPAGSYLLVVSFDPADSVALQKFLTVNNVAPGTPVYGPWDGELNNAEDPVELARPDVPDPIGTPTAGFVPYVLADKVNYKSAAPWPAGANGIGASISRLNVAAYGNDPANWKAAVKTAGAPTPGGTPPVITAQPVNTTAIETYSASFSVMATGTAPIGYQWAFNGEPIDANQVPSAVTSMLMLNNLTPEQAGAYACYVFNPGGTVLSSNAVLTVLRVATIVTHPVTTMVRVKPDPLAFPTTNATFTVAASSTTPLHYQWRFNGTNIAGQTGASLTITNVQVKDDGFYSVAITDDVGTVFTTNAPLYALVTPVITQGPLSQNVPQGGLVSASVTLGDGSPRPFFYEWRRGSSPIGTFTNGLKTNTITFFAQTNIATQQYRVVITNLANTNIQAVSAAFNVVTIADTDRDGMSDAFEIAYGLNTNDVSDALLDLDGDKMSNLAESLAGTDPSDSSSYLRVDQNTIPGSAVIGFGAISNRTYSIQYTAELGATAWSKLVDFPARSTNRVETFVDPGWNGGSRFYRVVIPAQP